MKIPLVGAEYQAASLAAAAQSCINLFPEIIEDSQERAKNKAYLRGIPGRHVFSSVLGGGASVQGLWSGGGRLFVAYFTNAYRFAEINQAGAIVSDNQFALLGSGQVAQILPNGNQLLIITAGLVFVDNGAGPVQVTFANSVGTVDTNGTAVVWISGDKFVTDGSWSGDTITINAVNYTISSVTDEEHLVLTGSAGTQTGVAYSKTGEPLTAVTGAILDSTFYVQRPQGGSPDLGRQVNYSAPLNGNSWRGLDFFRKEAYPDYIQSIWADNDQLYLFGTESLEIWQNNAAGIPEQVQGATQRFGSISRYSPASIESV